MHRRLHAPHGPKRQARTLVATSQHKWRHSDTLCSRASHYYAERPLSRRLDDVSSAARGSTPADVSSLRVPAGALSHALPHCSTRWRESAAVATSQHSIAGVARHNPIRHAPAGGPAFCRRAVATEQHSGRQGGAWGSQGVCRSPRLAASGGRDRAGRCHVAARPRHRRCHVAARRWRCSPRCLARATCSSFPTPSAGATRARQLPPSPCSQCSAPSRRGGCRPCAGLGTCPTRGAPRVSSVRLVRLLAHHAGHADAVLLPGSTPGTSGP